MKAVYWGKESHLRTRTASLYSWWRRPTIYNTVSLRGSLVVPSYFASAVPLGLCRYCRRVALSPNSLRFSRVVEQDKSCRSQRGSSTPYCGSVWGFVFTKLFWNYPGLTLLRFGTLDMGFRGLLRLAPRSATMRSNSDQPRCGEWRNPRLNMHAFSDLHVQPWYLTHWTRTSSTSKWWIASMQCLSGSLGHYLMYC